MFVDFSKIPFSEWDIEIEKGHVKGRNSFDMIHGGIISDDLPGKIRSLYDHIDYGGRLRKISEAMA